MFKNYSKKNNTRIQQNFKKQCNQDSGFQEECSEVLNQRGLKTENLIFKNTKSKHNIAEYDGIGITQKDMPTDKLFQTFKSIS